MKKFFKIFFISLGSLLGLVLILAGIAMWLIFTPSRLTPIVERQIPKFVDCQAEIGSVELTFFDTFPQFGIKADGLTLINPVEGAQCDTLLTVKQFKGAVDIKALLRGEIILSDMVLTDGRANAYISRDGKANFDIFPTDSLPDGIATSTDITSPDGIDTSTDTASSDGLGTIDANDLKIENLDLSYIDDSSGMKAAVKGLSGRIKGSVNGNLMDAGIELQPMDISFEQTATSGTDNGGNPANNTTNSHGNSTNSAENSSMRASLSQLSLKVAAVMEGDRLKADVNIPPVTATFLYGDEYYLREAKVDMNMAAELDMQAMSAAISNFALTVNGFRFDLSGTAANDAATNSIATDLAYKFDKWPVKELMALVPASMASYFNGIEADGLLSSAGTVKGEYRAPTAGSDGATGVSGGDPGSMPLIDARVVIENGAVRYAEMLPFPLKGVNGDFNIHTDLSDDKISYIRIDNLKAKTPSSSFGVTGKVDRLFSDMHADLVIDTDLDLEEFMPMLPADMNVAAKGHVAGKLKANTTMSQLTEMKLEKIKASGVLAMNGLDITYNDSLAVRSNSMTLDFALPNPNEGRRNTGFAAVKITADSLDARMEGLMAASTRNAIVELEASDVRDTTALPAMMCRFAFDDLSGSMDSMNLSAEKPSGSVSLSTRSRRADKPVFDVAFKSGRLYGAMDGDEVSVEKLDMKAGVTYDELQKDIFLKWMPRGSFEMENADIRTSMLTQNVSIPAVKMDFSPRTFNIEKAGVVIGNTDFNLSGHLTDILPYFRGRSTLKGDFNFTSSMTDIAMLMDLTSGMGKEVEDAEASAEGATADDTVSGTPEAATDETTPAAETPLVTDSGPYMVPKGMDIVLHTDIKQALWQQDTMRNIKGDVIVRDNKLLLDDIAFTSPATDMKLTAMYRTERKNHLFLGMNLHMLNIEIPELLHMIPDLETLMPMLASFDGSGEFRIVAETYLDSTYTLKMSTLRSAASIRGNNLVLMDGETFTEIAKMLRFNKKTTNKVDSLAAEFTIFRNQIDVYPFLLVMDKYKIIVGGRHDTNMSFTYNLSLVESPLPVRLSMKVSGTIDDLDFGLIKNPYKEFYRPASRQVVEGQQLQLRNLIRDTILKPKEENE